MRIALTGTPGTGKSAVASELRLLGEPVVELNRLAAAHNLLGPCDRKRHTREVRLDRLRSLLNMEPPAKERVFLEGHFSHLLNVERIIVLRCSPPVLRKRLARRGYPIKKIRENSLAEALDAITTEAVARLGKRRVFEIDTTRRKAPSVALEVLKLARRGFSPAPKYRPGRVDWSADIARNPSYYTRP